MRTGAHQTVTFRYVGVGNTAPASSSSRASAADQSAESFLISGSIAKPGGRERHPSGSPATHQSQKGLLSAPRSRVGHQGGGYRGKS
jgi:hypothetical protein